MNESQIIKGVIKGDAKAQRCLYENYKHSLFMICLRYGKDRAEAEDILQEGFIQIFKDIKQFRGKGALVSWMKRVMINKALQYLRKQKKNRLFFEAELNHDLIYPEPTVYEKMGAEELTRLVQRLPAGYRVVFNLYAIEGYTHAEIADLLGVQVSTSKSQLFKAKAALRTMLEKQLLT